MKHSITIQTKLLMSILISSAIFSSAFGQKNRVGEKAPSFALKDQDGTVFESEAYTGKKVLVIFFYPKDESGTCTKEACSFRDSYADFIENGAVVVGINAAGATSHKKFQSKNNLPFSLLSDPDNKTAEAFGVKKKFFVVPGRETFVIDTSGKIVFHFNNFLNGEEHAREVIEFLKKQS